MTSPLVSIRRGLILLAVFSVVAIGGHHWLAADGRSWLESAYWYVITITTVGYGERSVESADLQLLSIGVILIGVVLSGYTLGGVIRMMVEGEVEKALGRRRLTRELERIHDHVVICGYGRTGLCLAQDLSRHGHRLVIIERDPQHIDAAEQHGHLFVAGDATDEDILSRAHVDSASWLVSCLSSDADNVFVTLTARNINPDIQIISRGERASSESKLRQAGANQVILTAVVGAQRMARLITRPHAADLMDRLVNREMVDVEFGDIEIPRGSPLIGATVAETSPRRHHRLLVVSITKADGNVVFNPDEEEVFQAGDTLVVMGGHDDIVRFRQGIAV